ncbi:surface protease GP63 [Trypanosoma cruzi]|nr:surface protease GP63 [Trypanosoma cruzi]
MNSSNDNRHCEDDVVSSANGIILENEVVPAAVHPHADRMLVQPMEGPLIVPQFGTGSVCSRFTVRAGNCSTGVANADMVLCVAAALSVVVHSTTAAMAARSPTTATTFMAWSCRMAMGTGGRWSRTGRSATRRMSGWHRLVVPSTARS